MLSLAEIEDALQAIPAGFKSSADIFFKPCNEALLPEFKKLGVISNTTKESHSGTTATAESSPSATSSSSSNGGNCNIFCNVPGCELVFEGVADFQTHFNSVHRFVCMQCRRALPTAHLLDLHLSEQHDSFFAARVARGDPMYQCYLEECKQSLQTPEERRDHCVSAHKFPVNFRFDQLSARSVIKEKEKRDARMSMTQCGAALETEASVTATKIKTFSFGHQRERTFQSSASKKGRSNKGAAQTLDNLQELMDALDGNDEEVVGIANDN